MLILRKKSNNTYAKNKHLKNTPVYDPDSLPFIIASKSKKPYRTGIHFYWLIKSLNLTDTYIVGIKNVTFNEPFFVGHFPGNPIMPGVLQVEALAQTGGILAINAMAAGGQYDTYFLKIDNCKFKAKVVPGDTMVMKMELMNPIRRGIVEMRGTVLRRQ